jgi:hypothetical protein
MADGPARHAPGTLQRDLDRLAAALAGLLAAWWRARQNGKEEAAVDETAAEEVRDDGARSSA